MNPRAAQVLSRLTCRRSCCLLQSGCSKVQDDPRATRVRACLRRVRACLRRSRIDEIPQLLNVLRGELSLVRPVRSSSTRTSIERWARARLNLKPGITGLWQVLGASDIPFDEMTKLDYLHVTNWSLAADMRLLLLTQPSLTRTRTA
jgi:lipopolysaccharide/colanic/teichoic acid biosynthesis glycosyltransferase